MLHVPRWSTTHSQVELWNPLLSTWTVEWEYKKNHQANCFKMAAGEVILQVFQALCLLPGHINEHFSFE